MDPLALYIHWPFCLAKCPYCDFNSHVRERAPDSEPVISALAREVAFEAARIGPRPLASIFFGGGTPSLMPPAGVGRLIEQALLLFPPLADIEITLEANPTSVEAGRLAGYRAAGVNRLSLGVQSLDDAALTFLGRHHSAAEARAALAHARAIFPRVSFDLIYARPGQSEAEWRAELAEALALGPDHLSLYQLTIEPGTGFAARAARGDLVLPEPELAAALYEATVGEAAKFGLLPYEVSNYARPGAESRHNLAYWRYGDYAGIGPGAHGRLGIEGTPRAIRRIRAPEAWLTAITANGHGTAEERPLSPAERGREMLLMGLRLSEGVAEAHFTARTGLTFEEALDPAILAACLAENYLDFERGVLRALPAGRLRLDSLLAALLV